VLFKILSKSIQYLDIDSLHSEFLLDINSLPFTWKHFFNRLTVCIQENLIGVTSQISNMTSCQKFQIFVVDFSFLADNVFTIILRIRRICL